MITLGIFTQKGGCGKTTTSVNLASMLAEKGEKVLLIDIDPQFNASMSLGRKGEYATILDVMRQNSFKNAIIDININSTRKYKDRTETVISNLKIIPANRKLNHAEVELANIENNAYLMNDLLCSIDDEFDYCILDCNPGFGILSINALVASDYIVVPFETESFAVEGVKEVDMSLKKILEYNDSVKILGYLPTRFKRNKIDSEVLDIMKEYKNNKVFSPIKANAEITRAQRERLPINLHNDRCSGYSDYKTFTKELLERVKDEE